VGNLIQLESLRKYFAVQSGFVHKVRVDLKAVDGVSFEIKEGDTFGLVGESGCGKTTIGKVLLKLYEPTAGKIFFDGKDVTHLEGSSLNEYRKNIQAVFQNPYASLNPLIRIWKLVGEHCGSRFPHEMSAGQRQQIAIARALSINPRFIVLDEPTSLLDVSAQASILNMIVELQKKLDLTYLFISHNLAVVRFLSNRVGVMYCGKLVELADSRKLYLEPKHPYSQALLASTLTPEPELRVKEIVLEGDVISPINPPEGCRFYTRCQEVREGCKENEPPLLELEPAHFVACHLLR
jgi:oligopeptide/dipeptide ABC transporter ATP-binding protein